MIRHLVSSEFDLDGILSLRVRELSKQGAKIVDVDGSYLWRKQQQLKESGVVVENVGLPSPPPSGWVTINETNHKELAKDLPTVTSGWKISTMH